MSGSRLATQVEEGKAEKMVEGRKQQPIVEPALKPVFDVVRVARDLTRMECRVKPIRDHNDALLADFDEYFEETVDEIVSLSRDIIDHATNIRAQYGFKSPDAIHLAAAVASGCDVFLTNDHRLDRFKDITVDIVQV